MNRSRAGVVGLVWSAWWEGCLGKGSCDGGGEVEGDVWSVKLSLGQTHSGGAGTPKEVGFPRRWDRVRALWDAWSLVSTVSHKVCPWTCLRAPSAVGEGVEKGRLDPWLPFSGSSSAFKLEDTLEFIFNHRGNY